MPSHGSLTKSGKVRGHNPKQWQDYRQLKDGRRPWHKKKHLAPRMSKRRTFYRRVELGKDTGQDRFRRSNIELFERNRRYLER